MPRLPATAGRVSFVGCVIALAFVSACADIATAPLTIVTLTGTVTNPDGEPVVGARLYFLPPEEFSVLRPEPTPNLIGPTAYRAPSFHTYPSAFTDWNGRYQVDLTATMYDVYMEPPQQAGLPAVVLQNVAIRRSHPRLDYQYSGTRVTGSVTGPSGAPLSDAIVWFLRDDAYVETRSNALGYKMYIPPGTYTCGVHPPTTNSGIPHVSYRNVPFAADTTISFALVGETVTGTVFDPDGLPLERATVVLSNRDVRSQVSTAADGGYLLYAPPGTYNVFVYPPSERNNIFSRAFAPTSIAGPTTVDASFSGIVCQISLRRAGDGLPVGGAGVYVSGLGPYGANGSASGTTDASGVLSLYLPNPTNFSMSMYAVGYESFYTGFSVASDTTLTIDVEPRIP